MAVVGSTSERPSFFTGLCYGLAACTEQYGEAARTRGRSERGGRFVPCPLLIGHVTLHT